MMTKIAWDIGERLLCHSEGSFTTSATASANAGM